MFKKLFVEKRMEKLGKKWYFYLNNDKRDSLLKHYPREGLIVCWERPNRRLYGYFRNHIEFAMYSKDFPAKEKSFHEVIMGGQKPHFDFDNAQSLESLQEAIEEVAQVLIELLPIVPEQILLFTSHGHGKISAHLVVDGVFHRNNVQSREFFRRVLEKVSENTRSILDHGVYSSCQNFRILGSTKMGQMRPKKYSPLTLKGEQYSFPTPRDPRLLPGEILRASLISQIAQCKFLPDLVNESERKAVPDIECEKVRQIFEFCRSKMTEFPFQISSVEGNSILLKRTAPSMCTGCERIHMSENPYILCRHFDVYFYCRRGSCISLGQFEQEEEEIEFDDLDVFEFSYGENIDVYSLPCLYTERPPKKKIQAASDDVPSPEPVQQNLPPPPLQNPAYTSVPFSSPPQVSFPPQSPTRTPVRLPNILPSPRATGLISKNQISSPRAKTQISYAYRKKNSFFEALPSKPPTSDLKSFWS